MNKYNDRSKSIKVPFHHFFILDVLFSFNSTCTFQATPCPWPVHLQKMASQVTKWILDLRLSPVSTSSYHKHENIYFINSLSPVSTSSCHQPRKCFSIRGKHYMIL